MAPPKTRKGKKPAAKSAKSPAKPAKSHGKKRGKKREASSSPDRASKEKAPIESDAQEAERPQPAESPPKAAKNNLEGLFGLRGPNFLQKALTTCNDPNEMLQQFRNEEGILLPTLRPAVAFLDLMEVRRFEFHSLCAEELRQTLLDHITKAAHMKTEEKQKQLETLLEQSFFGLKSFLIRPIFFHILKNLEIVGEKYKKEIISNKELYDVCGISLRRKIWLDRKDFFQAEMFPLFDEWIENRRKSMFELNTTSGLYTIAGNVRRQDPALLKMVQNIGDSPQLYSFTVELIKRRYLADSHNPHTSTPTPTHSDTSTHTHSDTPTHAHSNTPTHAHSNTPTHAHSNTYTPTHIPTHIPTPASTHTPSPASTPTPAHTHAHTYTHYGTLRLDLLILLHEHQPNIVNKIDGVLYKFAFCMDACVRSRHVDSKRFKEITEVLDFLKKNQKTKKTEKTEKSEKNEKNEKTEKNEKIEKSEKNENGDFSIFQDIAMILSEPQMIYFNANSAMRFVQAVINQDGLPRDSAQLLFFIRLLSIGTHAKNYLTEKLQKEAKISPEICCNFLPQLCSVIVSISAKKIANEGLKKEVKELKNLKFSVDVLLPFLKNEPVSVWLVLQWIGYLLRANEQDFVANFVEFFPQFSQKIAVKEEHVVHCVVTALAHTTQERTWSPAFADCIFRTYLGSLDKTIRSALHILRLMYFVYPKLEPRYRDEILQDILPQVELDAEVKAMFTAVTARIATSVPIAPLLLDAPATPAFRSPDYPAPIQKTLTFS